jgi:hypothetical protein
MKRLLLIPIVAVTFVPMVTFAQFNLNMGSSMGSQASFGEVAPGVDGLFAGTSLISSPTYPEPYQSFTVELSAPSNSASGAIITWTVNGEEVVEAKNSRKHTFTAPGLGEKMTITTRLNKQDGSTETKSLVVTPVQLDIVVEAFTHVPIFYKGRAVPSAGTEGYASVITHTGTAIDLDNLTYQWKLNNNNLNGGPIRGKKSVSFTMPENRESYLGVTVSQGVNVIAEKTLPIRAAETEVLFYEDNPLRGVTGQAFKARNTFAGNQLTVRAEPYYAKPLQLPNEKYVLEWTLNGKKIQPDSLSELNSVTLRGSGSQSTASLNFRIVDFTKFAHQTTGSMSVTFGENN